MDDVQKRYFQLLCEIDDVCVQHQIPYFASGRLALHGYVSGSLPSKSHSPSIAIFAHDAKRFARAIEGQGKSDRVLDSALTNNRYPNFTMRYIDANTLCIDARRLENYRCHGIYVLVEMIEHCPIKPFRRFGAMLKTGWFENNCPYALPQSLDDKTRTSARTVKPLMTVGGQRAGKAFFTATSLAGSLPLPRGDFQISQANLGNHMLKRSWLDGAPSVIEIEGRAFPTFAKPEAYLKKIYGKGFRAMAARPTVKSIFRIIDASIPFDEYERDNADIIHSERYNALIAENDRLNNENVPHNNRIRDEWRCVRYVEKKWKLEAHFALNRLRYDNLLRNKAYDTLFNELSPYINHMTKGYEDIVPFHDPHLYDLCVSALKETYHPKTLEQYKQAIARHFGDGEQAQMR